MGTPSAALSVQQPPNALDQYSKLISLRSLLNAQQLQQAQLAGSRLAQQGQTMQNQQEALNLKSTRAWQQAFQQPDINWNSPDALEGVMSNAMKMGATPQSVAQFNSMLLDQRNKLASLDQTQLKTQQEQNDAMRGTLDSILDPNNTPEQMAQQWKQGVDDYIQKGWLKPGEITDQFPGVGPARALANHLALGSVLASEATAASQAKTAADRLKAELPGIEADNTIKQAQANAIKNNGLAGITPALADAQYRSIIEQQHMHEAGLADPLSQEQLAFKAAYEAQKTLVPKFNFTLQSGQMSNYVSPQQAQLHGNDFLKTVSPQDRATLQALATGRIEFPSSFALRTPYWERMTALLNQYDPSFSQQRAELRKEFLVSGKSANNIRSLNVATAHLDTLADAAQALQNGSFTPGNAAYNAVKTWFGAAPPTTFNALKNAVAGEMANALKGSATDTEIENVEKTIKASSSPRQFKGVIGQMMHIMAQKLGVYEQQYQQQNPGDTLFSPILPQTQQILDHYAQGQVQPNAGASRPTIVGPNDHTLVLSADGKSWVPEGTQ